MHNLHCPDDLLLNPQSLQRAGFGALAVALLLLLVAVLPAGFAIDPTGIGRLLGLTHMGELRQVMARSTRMSYHSLAQYPQHGRGAGVSSAGVNDQGNSGGSLYRDNPAERQAVPQYRSLP